MTKEPAFDQSLIIGSEQETGPVMSGRNSAIRARPRPRPRPRKPTRIRGRARMLARNTVNQLPDNEIF